MRNLKKTLCLVLALIFVLGLCTVGVGATNGTEFSDADDITYEGAVTAMSGLGILIGNDDNGDGVAEFRPKDDVTRAEAAKMIAYMVLGPDADKYPKIQVFDDVSSDHWAASYIAYCQNNGIIAGYGNGKFGPGDPVTQAQYCRMLLSACGYGAKDEFIGEAWSQNVAKLAMQSKILKSLEKVDWDGKAAREETALLTYNTMMTVDKVVLSKDTNDYVLKVVGGDTFAESTWNLITDEGIIEKNLTNDSSAKGTDIIGISVNWPAPAYYVTPDDDNADIIGHQVKILYRWEKINNYDTAVAYYVEDLSKEVNGMVAANIENSTHGVFGFDYGVYTPGMAIPATGMHPVVTSYPNRLIVGGSYVLDNDGKLIAYKTTGFFLAMLTVNASGVKQVVEPYGGATVTVKAPDGAKAGDILAVTKNGDIYTGEATTKETKVNVAQKALVNGRWTYNDGAIALTGADNAGAVVTAAITPYTGADLLQLDWNYTLFFDPEGGCFGYADGIAGNADSVSYVKFIADYSVDDAYGTPVNYAQVIGADGKVDSLKVAAATGLTRGDICSVTTNALTGISTLTLVADTTKVYQTADGQVYNPSVATMDYSNATFIYDDGVSVKAALYPSTSYRPAIGSAIAYTYTSETVGTTIVRRVQAVWFTTAAAASPTADSYLYVNRTGVKEYRVINDTTVSFFYGYIDGTAMTDFRTAGNTENAVGFYRYSKSATTGNYTLYPVAAGTGAATGSRNVYLYNQDTTNYILSGKLYAGNTYAIDLDTVTFVKVGAVATNFASLNLSNTAAIQTALLNGYTVEIAFVENVVGTTHSVGGKVAYIYNVVKP